MKKKEINIKRIIILLLILIILIGGLFYFNRSDSNSNTSDSSTITYNNKQYELKENVTSILFIGLDKWQDEASGYYTNNEQADFILLAVYDADENTTKLLLLNRDTMCDYDLIDNEGNIYGTSYGQLALSHNYGNGDKVSARNVRNAVSKILNNMDLNYFTSVELDGAKIVNDSLGGIEMDGKVLLGDEFISWVRARKELDIPTNVERMNRHIEYLNKFKTKLQTKIKEDPDYLDSIVWDVYEYLETNMTTQRIVSLFNSINESEIQDIQELDGSFEYSENVEFYPSEDSIMTTVLDLYYKEK